MKCPDYIGTYHVMCCEDNCGWKGKANECDFRDDSLVYLRCPKCGYFITEDIQSQLSAILDKVPRKKIREIREPYWYCGIDGDGHYHKTEGSAMDCVEKQKRESVRKALPDRNKAILKKVLDGDTMVAVGKEYGITPSRVDQIIARLLRAARKKLKFHFNDNELQGDLKSLRTHKEFIYAALEIKQFH